VAVPAALSVDISVDVGISSSGSLVVTPSWKYDDKKSHEANNYMYD
jgi:hypothetical protein